MKHVTIFLLLIFPGFTLVAQRPIPLRNLWERPQVHVQYQQYTISFTIKDIDRALQLMNESGDSSLGTSCGLDTAGNYLVELYPGLRQEYHSRLQMILQQGIGAFLLSAGHAVVVTDRRKKLKAIVDDKSPEMDGLEQTAAKFFDPETDALIFEGVMLRVLVNRDLGID